MQETLTRLSMLNAPGKSLAARPRAGEWLADDDAAPAAIAHAIEARFAAVDRVFAHEAAVLVENSIRRR